jgi:hypothetical protein
MLSERRHYSRRMEEHPKRGSRKEFSESWFQKEVYEVGRILK